MKSPLLLSMVAGIALVAGAAGGQWVGGTGAPSDAEAATEARLAQVLERLDAMELAQRALQRSVESVSLAAPAPPPAALVSPADIEAAVARYLQARGADSLAALSQADADVASDVRSPDASALFAELLDPALSDQRRQELFDEAREGGVLDELVALFEQQAADHPQDPAAQLALGAAYIQKIFEVGDGPAAGVWAVKADKAYDAALTLDPQHWEARFSKAVALSFWPPIFGKQAEAIGHLETLLEQQSSQAPQPKFAQVYLSLGNLYLQSGKSEQALAVFAAGLKLFPDDADLLAKSGP